MAFSWGNYDALEGVGPAELESAAVRPSSLVTGLGLGPPAPSSALSEASVRAVPVDDSFPHGRDGGGVGREPRLSRPLASLSALNGGEPGHSVNGHPRSLPAGGSAVVSAPDIMGSGASPPLSAPPSLSPKGGGRAHLLAHPHAVGWKP